LLSVWPLIIETFIEMVSKLCPWRNFQLSSEKNEEGGGILGLKSADD